MSEVRLFGCFSEFLVGERSELSEGGSSMKGKKGRRKKYCYEVVLIHKHQQTCVQTFIYSEYFIEFIKFQNFFRLI